MEKKEKLKEKLKEILNADIYTGQLLVLILLGGIAFLLQGLFPNKNFALGFLVYVAIGSIFFLFINSNKKIKKRKVGVHKR